MRRSVRRNVLLEIVMTVGLTHLKFFAGVARHSLIGLQFVKIAWYCDIFVKLPISEEEKNLRSNSRRSDLDWKQHWKSKTLSCGMKSKVALCHQVAHWAVRSFAIPWTTRRPDRPTATRYEIRWCKMLPVPPWRWSTRREALINVIVSLPFPTCTARCPRRELHVLRRTCWPTGLVRFRASAGKLIILSHGTPCVLTTFRPRKLAHWLMIVTSECRQLLDDEDWKLAR